MYDGEEHKRDSILSARKRLRSTRNAQDLPVVHPSEKTAGVPEGKGEQRPIAQTNAEIVDYFRARLLQISDALRACSREGLQEDKTAGDHARKCNLRGRTLGRCTEPYVTPLFSNNKTVLSCKEISVLYLFCEYCRMYRVPFFERRVQGIWSEYQYLL